jgi:hypothetical protein
MYEVYVGNIGSVYLGANKREAEKKYRFYVKDSKTGLGRSGSEPVTLMCDGEIAKQYQPNRPEQDKPKVTLRLTLDVIYTTNGVDTAELKGNLRQMVWDALRSNGTIGESESEVEDYSFKVEEVI